MDDSAHRVYAFHGYRLDAVARTLSASDGADVPLTAKALDVLLHLIARRERVVGKDELLAAVWPGRVIEENNLTQAISALRRALGTGAGDRRFVVTVPGRGYQFVATLEDEASPAAASAPPLPPPGEAQAAATVPVRQPRGVRWGVLAAAALASVLLLTMALRERTPPGDASGATASPPTLAVLPFRHMGERARRGADAMLELGMAETLIARLSRSTSLRVLSLGSMQGFLGREADPLRTGMTLGADYVVDGSTQRLGDRIRVNARLVSLPDGRTVWAGTFDQHPDRVFTLQDAIAEGMSAALSLTFPANVPHRSPCDGVDAQAYRAYLRGRHLGFRPSPAQLPQAIAAYRQAIARDPDCARAWAGIGHAYRALAMTGDRNPRATFALAKGAVANALAIDPASAEAHAAKGFIEFFHDWDWAVAETSLRHAIDLNHNLAEAHFGLAHLLVNTGRGDEAEPYARKAALLDPLSPLVNAIVASFFMYAGDTGEAAARLEKVLQTDPEFWIAQYMRGWIALDAGRVPTALSDLQRAGERCMRCSHVQAMLVRAHVHGGDREAARRVLAQMEARGRAGYMPATRLALAYEALGERQRALALLELGYRERDIYMIFLRVDGRFDGMRGEPRFVALLRRMQLGAAAVE